MIKTKVLLLSKPVVSTYPESLGTNPDPKELFHTNKTLFDNGWNFPINTPPNPFSGNLCPMENVADGNVPSFKLESRYLNKAYISEQTISYANKMEISPSGVQEIVSYYRPDFPSHIDLNFPLSNQYNFHEYKEIRALESTEPFQYGESSKYFIGFKINTFYINNMNTYSGFLKGDNIVFQFNRFNNDNKNLSKNGSGSIAYTDETNKCISVSFRYRKPNTEYGNVLIEFYEGATFDKPLSKGGRVKTEIYQTKIGGTDFIRVPYTNLRNGMLIIDERILSRIDYVSADNLQIYCEGTGDVSQYFSLTNVCVAKPFELCLDDQYSYKLDVLDKIEYNDYGIHTRIKRGELRGFQGQMSFVDNAEMIEVNALFYYLRRKPFYFLPFSDSTDDESLRILNEELSGLYTIDSTWEIKNSQYDFNDLNIVLKEYK